MQDCYVGDIGDFLKYGLLNFLLENQPNSPKFKLGVNWYLVPDEKHGKYTDYLKPENRFSKSLQECNPELYRQMNEIVFGKKKGNIAEIEKGRVLPKGTIFYSELLRYDNIAFEERERKRKEWHEAALRKLGAADVIFLDPDNGIETGEMSLAWGKSPKYALFHEIVDYYEERGQSVIVYNHRSNQEEEIYQKRFRKLRSLARKVATIYILRAQRYTVRDFVFLVQPKHEELMEKSISNFLKSNWVDKKHFKKVELLC